MYIYILHLVGWDRKIHIFTIIERLDPVLFVDSGYETKFHLIVRRQCWIFGECAFRLPFHYSQVEVFEILQLTYTIWSTNSRVFAPTIGYGSFLPKTHKLCFICFYELANVSSCLLLAIYQDMHNMYPHKMHKEKARWKLNEDATGYFEQIQKSNTPGNISCKAIYLPS